MADPLVTPGSQICAAAALQEGGQGTRFTVQYQGREEPAFVVRWNGDVHAFLNRCAHVPMELDWQPGQFFDADSFYILCSTHGAHYEPSTGLCVLGPCKGKRLHALAVREEDGMIYLGQGQPCN
jgi:nitrite reductase/ring-hydroxylating ferredoxin subunit